MIHNNRNIVSLSIDNFVRHYIHCWGFSKHSDDAVSINYNFSSSTCTNCDVSKNTNGKNTILCFKYNHEFIGSVVIWLIAPTATPVVCGIYKKFPASKKLSLYIWNECFSCHYIVGSINVHVWVVKYDDYINSFDIWLLYFRNCIIICCIGPMD